MKQLNSFFLPVISIVLLGLSCSPNPILPSWYSSGRWLYLNLSFLGDQRNSAVSFVIGNNAYLGTGDNRALKKKYSDLFSYNVDKGWTQLNSAPLAFKPRSNASAFVIGSNGYVTLGEDNNGNLLTDTWQYNTITNSWTQKSNFSGTPRIDATAFGIGNYGYVVCGNTSISATNANNTNDSWVYDPAADTWNLTTVQFTGTKRNGAIAFVYNSKAYIVTGSNNGVLNNDFIVFDPSNTITPWQSLRNIDNSSSNSYDDDYTDIMRDHGVGFVLGDSAYITLGNNHGYNVKTWGYDFIHDAWFHKANFENAGRVNAVAFSIQGESFITTGKNDALDFDDLNEWKPYQ